MAAATVVLHLSRITKGALMYEGQGEEHPKANSRLIGTLYIRKDGVVREFGVAHGEWPEQITVTIGVDA